MVGRLAVDRTAIALDIASGAVGRRLVDVAGLLLRLAGPAGKEAREKPGNDLSQGGADAVGNARLAAVFGLRRLRRGTPPDPQPACHDEHNHGSPRRRTLDHGSPPACRWIDPTPPMASIRQAPCRHPPGRRKYRSALSKPASLAPAAALPIRWSQSRRGVLECRLPAL